jgi:hypothetical protein
MPALEAIMSLTELLPAVKSLTRTEQFKLIQIIAAELEREEPRDPLALLEPGATYAIYTPEFAPGAADKLMQALEEHKQKQCV